MLPMRRRSFLATSLFPLAAAAALTSCLVFNEPALLMITIIIAQVAAVGIATTFWALPTAMLTGSAAAGRIALIN
jgi:ACS family tartrate transporter-like MFS transporter